jgi:hypothetical protein
MEMPFHVEKFIFQQCQTPQQRGPLHGPYTIFCPSFFNYLLADKASRKVHGLTIGPGNFCWNPMGSADEQPMFVELAAPILIDRTHNLGSLTGYLCLFTGLQVYFCPVNKRLLLFWGKPSHPLPEVCPLCIGVMKKIGITTVVRAAGTTKIQLACDPLVLFLQLGVYIF